MTPTPEQISAIQQVWPQGGVMFVPGNYGDYYTSRQWVEYTDGHIVKIAENISGSQANVRPLRRYDIPPLDPLKAKVEAWLATLPGGVHSDDKTLRYVEFGHHTMYDNTAHAIIQSWEKFKEQA